MNYQLKVYTEYMSVYPNSHYRVCGYVKTVSQHILTHNAHKYIQHYNIVFCIPMHTIKDTKGVQEHE